MSSPMMPPPGGGGMPPSGGQDPLKAMMSPLNGPDAALMKKSGQSTGEGTFGEFMEGSFGIKWEDPMQVAVQKLKGAAGNATPQGKMKSMAGMAGGGAPPMNQVPGMPQRPQPAGRPMAAQGGLESLMGGMR